ncbi:MAG: Inner membrane protein YgaZ [Chlamydiia bacterium]|nr:Inner membrane protein YgaZ [Chlamydiia bacterium]MCH9616588.1 Inner membrane protein YgaZ [Chlamydiia bacterium]MCH9629318.1 Inner membrane protein YgaZ [Chlamydiia bacterium]
MRTFREAFFDSIPAFCSYLPLGIVFGLLFQNLALPWFMAPFMSFIVLAGTIQFVLLATIAAKASLIAFMITAFFIALRNSFYGLSVLDRYNVSPMKKHYLIFGLVDATYSVISSKPEQPHDTRYLMWLTALIHSSWVIGTFIGAYFSNPKLLIPGLEFSLTALFTVFFIEQWKKSKDYFLVLTALITFSLAYLVTPTYAFLVGLIASCFYLSRRKIAWT